MLSELLQSRIQKGLAGLPVEIRLGQERVNGGVPVSVTITANELKAWALLANPTLGGLARAYVEGWISIDGEAHAILAVAQAYCGTNAAAEASGNTDWRWWRHTRSRDRRNISYHYDVSNDFYGLWLDSRRVYSCAYFEQGDESLDQAQEKKIDLICRKLMLKPGESLLDIGCGWGALILHAVEHYGVTAMGITLSENQRDYVLDQISARGLEGRIEVHLMDYRDLPAELQFDKIASVGMFEHVGQRHLRDYFNVIYALLKPGGLAMNHGITSVALKGSGLGSGISEFIEQYVFPGGELVHISRVAQELAAAGLEPLDMENLRPHYGKTLWEWVSRLEARESEALALIDEKKYRIWRIYMAGSAFAFDSNWLALFQVLVGKPREDGTVDYPYNRKHIYI